MANPTLSKYQAALSNLKPGGCGNNTHTAILGVANLGVIAGIAPQTIFEDIRQNIPEGKRRISDREIKDAINKALVDYEAGTFTPKPKPAPVVLDGKAALRRIIEQSDIDNEADLWELSPIRLLEAV